MKKTDLAYYAGIFDGEGTVSIYGSQQPKANRRQTYAICAKVSSTDEWLCCQLRFAFGGTLCCQTKAGNFKPLWRWEVRHNQAYEFLKSVLPYLRLKRERTNLAIKFQEHKIIGGRKTKEYMDFETDYKFMMTSLNKRGK